MRRFSLALIAAVVSIAFAQIASAAAPVPYTWTGFYVGAHAGGGWGNKDWDFTNTTVVLNGPQFSDFFPTGLTNGHFPASYPVSGFLGGGQFGYRYQSDVWVFGVEGTFSGADITGNSSGCFDFSCSTKIDWLATFTGQVGWAIQNALLYLKGGGAWVHEKHSLDWETCLSGLVCTGADLTTTRSGWLFGVGFAYAFDRQWSAFVEYNYMDFGTMHGMLTVSEIGPGGSLIETRALDVDQKLQVVKAGVNFRFWPR